ncbi:sugar ABC transporter ATP-binding protein [Cryptosporangium arvum]|uniref:ABC-type sugar transport system, ATPase component n=1 Tax=Cryptosporangium arvum DSM 44712 TaxID=927661 RepID=A0A010ZPJ9_9ACTN|nr:sugar ABC transporter ATP-binding protein [Cryptosporangium arvum]EXG80609.1 ABC-type sugar transport system, ATPase component [Cryptosporangium arvum DSM 44712]
MTLHVEAVSKRFLGVLALDRVDLVLRAGRVHALVGENGAGKSTLIKVMTGVHRPDGGRITYRGEEVGFAAPRDAQAAGISTIYQELNLVAAMSVARNLFLGREPLNRLRLIDFPAMHREAQAVLGRYGVAVDVRRALGEFSTGVQQMVAIARAVSTRARVVIMDEPTSSLEPREVDRLAQVIDLLRADDVAVLFVTHKLDEVFRLCQDVTVLRDGRRVFHGEVADIDRLGLVATMLGRPADEVRAHGLTSFGDGAGAGRGDDGVAVLRADDLTRRGALSHVSVDVRPGEVVGLAGLLGSGRSETVRAMFGAEPVDSGTILVGGKPTGRRWSPARAIAGGIGLVSEDRKVEGIVPDLSVRDNLVLAALPRLARAGFVSRRRCDALVDTFVRRLRIKMTGPDQPVRELSGGNQQKVLLARMLCLSPQVLLLDEPTRGIDVGAKAEIQALIDELAGAGLGVVLISSELEELVEGATRVFVLRDGAVVGSLAGDAISEHRIMTTIAAAAREEATSD